MPAISTGRENVNAGKRKPAAKKPAPQTRPTGVFKPGMPKPATAPITRAQTQARQQTVRVQRKAPAPIIAAPPVVRNPTPKQVKAAKQQIVTTIRTAVGTGGTGAQRNQRRDAIMRQVRTDPRLRTVQLSINHWAREDAKLTGPQTRATAKAVKPNKKRIGIGPLAATVNFTAASTTLANVGEKVAPGLKSATAESKFAKNALSDLAHLPLMVPQTAYEVSMAAKEAAGGDTTRAKAIAKGFTEGVYGLAAQGKWSELEDYVREHPVYAALELRGGKGIGGRGAGAVMRSGAVGKTARRAASTRRADDQLAGDTGSRVASRRHYSPDVITKAFQVLDDRRRAGKQPRLADHKLRRRADFESDMAASTSRTVRADEAGAVRQAKPKGPLADVVGLVVQGVVRPKSLEADLRKELGRLDTAHATAEFSTGAQKRQNRASADAIRAVLSNPKAMARLGEVAQSGRANVKAINALEQQAIDLGALTPERADRAKLFPAAQAHLGAAHGGITRAQGKRVVAKARTELERSRGARDHVLERLKAEGVKKPTTHGDYKKAVARVATAKEGLETARQLRRSGAVMLRDAQGDPLPSAAIRQAVGEDVAYLPHNMRNRGARAFYQTSFAGRKNLDTPEKRTGAAFEKGAVDSSYQAITEHRVRLRGVVNRIAEHDQIIHNIAIKGPGGKMMTWDQANKVASNAKDKGARLVPYRAAPGGYDRARLQQIAARQDAADMPELTRMIESEFAERLKEPAPGDRSARNVVLVPEQIINQLQAQQKATGSTGAAFNIAADVFRRTVLPFSTKWMMGNLVEAGVRLGTVGAGPNSVRIGRALLKEVDKVDHDQALRVRAALTGGLLFGNEGLTVKRVSEHFEGSALEKPAKAVSLAGQAPVVRQLGQVMKQFTDGIFTLNRAIESMSQQAALGKWAKREMQEMTGSWAKATRAQEAALQDLARGMTDSKNIQDAARYIDSTMGQYSRFSPGMRNFIQKYAPFVPWYINSMRWVGYTLPAKHPIKVGLYTTVAANLQEDFDAAHKGLPPGDLRGAIVADDGTTLPYQGFTPFGAFGGLAGGGNEQLTALVDPFFPQFKSAALATFGLNFGAHAAKIDPRDKGGERDVPGAVRLSMAFNSLLEAFVPVVGIGRRVREGGSTPYDNSTIWDPKPKPGTKVPGGAANRILNPLRPSPIKGTAKTTTATAPQAAPAQDEIDAALDAAAAALDNVALDDVDAALDVIP